MNATFDPTLENDIKELMKEVPAPIRAFFASGKVEVVAKNLMQKYQLHIDQGAVVEREIILLLLGLKDPTEFTQALAEEAKLDQQTISNITKDVNEQIFVPLREEMRRGGGGPQAPAKPAAPASSETSQGTAREKVMPLNTVIIPANPQMPSHQAQTFASMLKYSPPQKYFNLQNKIPPPATTKPMDSSKLLEDHEEPHIEFGKTVPPPARPMSGNPFGAFSVNKPPANLPWALPPLPVPPKAEPPKPPAPPATTKPYSTDPYRE